MVGIVGYGACIPRYRIKVEEISKIWGANAESYKRGLGLTQKSVPGPDQDVISLSVEAARNALKRAKIDPKKIGCLYIGSESHPYAVKPSGTVVADAIGAAGHIHISSLEFACKAGTEGMYLAYAQVKAGLIEYGMGIGADTSQGAPSDALEYSTAAGAAAFIFGSENVVATVDFTHSYTTDTPDFWRREYQHYPRHGSRFTGEPAYFHHIYSCGKALLEKSNMKPEDFKYAVFHQPNGKFPLTIGKKLGFKEEQLKTGLLVPTLGNTYSGSSPMGLTAILDEAKPGDRIFMVSFGSGAGSDGFIYTVTEEIKEVQNLAPKTRDYLDKKLFFIDYGTYAKFRKKILKLKED